MARHIEKILMISPIEYFYEVNANVDRDGIMTITDVALTIKTNPDTCFEYGVSTINDIGRNVYSAVL